ncbi:MAG: hypothetical protein WKG01_33890 [Kofleriaceae bacterium]
MTRIELGPTHGGTVAIAAIVLLCSVMGGPIGLAIGAVLAAAIVAVRLRRRLIVDDDGITTRDVLETRAIPGAGRAHHRRSHARARAEAAAPRQPRLRHRR